MRNIYIILMSFLILSCDDFVDIKPKGKIIPETTEDLFQLMNNRQRTGVTIGITNTVLMSDNIVIPKEEHGGVITEHKHAYTWLDDIFLYPQIDKNWQKLYGSVYAANYVLDKIDGAEVKGAHSREEIKAYALMTRSYALFALVNMYGKHWEETTASEDLGIPMPLIADINKSYARSTVDDVYTQIINDITNSIDHLPDTQDKEGFNHLPSKAAAYGLLSRIYLYTEKFTMAQEFSRKAIALHDKLYDLNTEKYPLSQRLYKSCIWDKFSQPSGGWIVYYLSDELVSMYSADDQRLKMYEVDVRYKKPRAYPNFGIKSGIYVSELYLNEAEALCWLKQYGAARDVMNKLLRNRYKVVPDLNQVLDEDLLEFVLEERRKEFVFAGHRLFDLKRLNKHEKFKKVIKRKFMDKEHILNPDDKNYILPIPAIDINMNPKLVQNPRDGRE